MYGSKYFKEGGSVATSFDAAPHTIKKAMAAFMEGQISEGQLIEIFKSQGLDPKIIPKFIEAMRAQGSKPTPYNMNVDMGVPPMPQSVPTKSVVSPRGGSTGVRAPQALKRK